jgi:hypothetical protein
MLAATGGFLFLQYIFTEEICTHFTHNSLQNFLYYLKKSLALSKTSSIKTNHLQSLFLLLWEAQGRAIFINVTRTEAQGTSLSLRRHAWAVA